MGLNDSLHHFDGIIFMAGNKSFLMRFWNVWMAYFRLAYDKFRMGSFRDVCKSWNSAIVSSIANLGV